MLRFFRAIFSVLGDIERICSVFSADFKPIFYSQVGGLDRSEWVDMLRFRHTKADVAVIIFNKDVTECTQIIVGTILEKFEVNVWSHNLASNLEFN